MVGSGHGRKWAIRFDNDIEIEVSARSFQVEDEYDGSSDGSGERNGGGAQMEAGNHQDPQAAPLGDLAEHPGGHEEFGPAWAERADYFLYVFQRLLNFIKITE
jgi:hypothetical protein